MLPLRASRVSRVLDALFFYSPFVYYLFQNANAFCTLSLWGFAAATETVGYARCVTEFIVGGGFDAAASFSNSFAVRLTLPVGTNLLRIRPISSRGSSFSVGSVTATFFVR